MDSPVKAIAVISDTHGTVPRRLVERLEEADEIWHLGDVTRPQVLRPIQQLKAPLAVVRGNCDPELWPLQLEFERAGYRFRLQHLPPRLDNGHADAVLYGHLHQPLQDSWHGTRLLNPGAITNPRNGSQPSFAWIRFHPAGWSWEIETL